MTCWQTLGIAPTSDEAAIKKAYAARIYQDSGEWVMTAFILLCLLHAIASIEYHLKHPA